MKLECSICFFRDADITGYKLIINADIPTFHRLELEQHLIKEHTIEEIVSSLSLFHWQLMFTPNKPELEMDKNTNQ